MTRLLQTVESIAGDDVNFKMKKPLPKESTRKQKTIAKKDLSKVFETILKTVQPEGTVTDNMKLAADTLDELKQRMGGDEIVDESLKSLISQYKSVENRVIKRALLGEIAKKLSYLSVLKHVDGTVTRHE